jgi:hypothetical protein
MDKPDQRLFDEDLLSAEFRAGAAKGFWGVPGQDLVPEPLDWPKRVLWIAAAARPSAPPRYYVLLDLAGYRSVPPTGTFWDVATKTALENAKRPKGSPDSRFAKVFRTDWNNNQAFYHPYDRAAAQGHPDWPKTQPHLTWTDGHTIVDYLQEMHSLLTSGDYLGN